MNSEYLKKIEKNPLTHGLTSEQLEAVTWIGEGKLKISAGAGSGKTEVLTRRIAWLLENGIKPNELVAITYTQKAAAEMKMRLIEKRKISLSILRDMEVSTFHAFLGRFLRKDPFGAGIDRSDTVIEEGNKQLLLVELIEKFATMFGSEIIDGEKALGATVAMKLIKEFPSALGKIRRYLMKPGEFYQFSYQIFKNQENIATHLEKNCLEWLFQFYTLYLEELKKRGLLDFDQLLISGLDLVKSLREAGSGSERRIFLIDEFQDNNPDQLGIVKEFCFDRKSHISVVGDEKQSIYRFQGANINTFRDFDSDKDIILTDNFRSYREIIDLADRFLKIGGNNKKLLVPQIARRGDSPRYPPVVCLLSPYESTQDEICEEFAKMIKTLANSGMSVTDKKDGCQRAVRYGDIAIIVSSISKIPKQFEDALSARQIPYLMSGGLSFYSRSEIEEILSFLRLLVQPDDDRSLVKILSGSLYGLDDSELAKFASDGRNEKMPLLPHLLSQNPSLLPPRARQIRELFLRIKEHAQKAGLLDLCHFILEQAGFYEFAASQQSELHRRRMENNIAKFLGIVRKFEQKGIFTSLRDFLSYIDRILFSAIDEDEAGLGLEEGDAVKIMTIHKSKGLEFPIVFCPFMKKRRYKSTSRIIFDKQYGLLVKDPLLPVKKALTPAFESFIESDKIDSENEDRRKLYVAFTRAEDLLVIMGTEVAAQETEKNDELVEPIYEIRKILDENPSIGETLSLNQWSDLINQWTEQGHCQTETVKKSLEPIIDLEELEKNLGHLCAFYQRSNLDSVKLSLTNSELQGFSNTSPSEYEKEIFSLQDINLFNSCPRKYFFTSRNVSSFYDRQIKFSSILGTLIHESIRIFHIRDGHKLKNISEIEKLLFSALEELLPCYGEAGKTAKSMSQNILHNYAGCQLAITEPWMLEAEVNVKFEGNNKPFFVRGFSDRVDLIDGEIRIIDYKTCQYSPEAHEKYRDQLSLYRIAAKLGVLGKRGYLNPARSYIAYISTHNFELVEIEPDMKTFEEYLQKTVASIRLESTWLPGKNAPCSNCGFAVLCFTES